jgi:bidirectional [NiFe] hydrogenase diaphorase subunit
MPKIGILIDGRRIEAEEGERVLEVALRHGIFIPNLCYRPGAEEPFAGCRLCWVEVEGKSRPATSCTEVVRDGMVVRTDTEPVRRLQRSALRLLLSAHHIDCRNCYANKRCALQQLAKQLDVKLKIRGLRDLSGREPLDGTLGSILYDKNRCVLCARCTACSKEQDLGVFHLAKRGLQMRVAVFPGKGDSESLEGCRKQCPVGALIPADAELHIGSLKAD